MIKVVFGLGNKPLSLADSSFFGTRHNVGSDWIIRFSEKHLLTSNSTLKIFRAKAWDIKQVRMIICDGYMNQSGENIKPIMRFLAVEPKELLVVHDDIELPYGKLSLKDVGSHKGHNGIRNIIETLRTDNFLRARIGVGKDFPVDQYVLSPHSADKLDLLESSFEKLDITFFNLLEQGS